VSAGDSNSLAELLAKLRTGEPALLEVIAAFAERAAQREPDIHAFVPEEKRFERLRRDAQRLVAKWPGAAERPPLFGLPVGVKDVYRVNGLATGAGSRLDPRLFAGAEAESVGALRAAGALVAGKTVSTEFAYFAPGPTRNPHDFERTPGGSSSGSAAAVAAGLVPVALGTQTIGSIGRPAAFCGVVGFKPSHDRVSTAGVIPLSPSLDHVGFFTATVGGAAIVARVLCAPWRENVPHRRAVLAVPTGPYLDPASQEGRAHFGRTVARLQRGGYEVRSIPAMPDFGDIAGRHRRIVAAEAARVHEPWFERHRALYDSRTVELIERGREVGPAQLERDLAGRGRLRQELEALLATQGADLWLSPPATGPAPLGLASTGDPILNLPWTHSGLPTLVLPAGRGAGGLPMGLQVAARFGADEELLAWAVSIEEALSR
jgi:Asp-tRNA(Asn)/Glu-tRNA(Gln) amidotransferase A subunit family amidase